MRCFISSKAEKLVYPCDFLFKNHDLDKGANRFWDSLAGQVWWKHKCFAAVLILVTACTVLLHTARSKYIEGDDAIFLDDFLAPVSLQKKEFQGIPKDGTQKYRITVCAIIKNEVHSLLEWIEFHRIQGVDHFVLYSDNSSDGVELLPTLYEQIGVKGLVEVFSAPQNILPILSIEELKVAYHRKQLNSLNHCYQYIGNRSEWFLIIDPDEFVATASGVPLAEELNDPKWDLLASIQLRNINYGTSGLLCPFESFLELNEEGEVVVSYVPSSMNRHRDGSNVLNEGFLFPLILGANRNRMPYDDLDLDPVPPFPNDCHAISGVWQIHCQQKIGKYFVRSGKCKDLYVHWCEEFESGFQHRFTVASRNEFRMHHYYAKNAYDMEREKKWSSAKRLTYNYYDANYLSLVKDDIFHKRYARLIRENISKFNLKIVPSKYRVSGRHCVEDDTVSS